MGLLYKESPNDVVSPHIVKIIREAYPLEFISCRIWGLCNMFVMYNYDHNLSIEVLSRVKQERCQPMREDVTYVTSSLIGLDRSNINSLNIRM